MDICLNVFIVFKLQNIRKKGKVEAEISEANSKNVFNIAFLTSSIFFIG